MIDRTKHGWLLVACLLINSPPPDENDTEMMKYRIQILNWYCTIMTVGGETEDGWPAEAQQWTSYYLAWYRNTQKEKDDDC